MRLCTIGYERAAFADFAAALVAAGVTTVIDVRAEPHSRRREFALKHLGPELAAYGVGYESWPELGTPAAGRAAAKRGDMAAFARIFDDQLASDRAQCALDALLPHMMDGTPCLMCYERDPGHCHRTWVAKRLTTRGDFDIHNLYA